MKGTNHSYLPIPMLLLMLILPSLLLGSNTDESLGVVSIASKPVWVEREGNRLEINAFGLKLIKGDTVKTGVGGRAQIVLHNGNSIYLAPASELQLTAAVIGEEESGIGHVIRLIYGKLRAKIQKQRKERFEVKTTTATIGVKGTDFITEFVEEATTVGTIEGTVNLISDKSGSNVDIPAGAMASVSVSGELMPLTEFAGELMEGVEFAGEKMTDEAAAGEKIDL